MRDGKRGHKFHVVEANEFVDEREERGLPMTGMDWGGGSWQVGGPTCEDVEVEAEVGGCLCGQLLGGERKGRGKWGGYRGPRIPRDIPRGRT